MKHSVPARIKYSVSVQIGDEAPDFTLPDQSGNPVHLRSLLERGPVVLYFYPKDETSGCTAEACSFRDAYEDFRGAGAEVVGVSSDSVSSHEAFSAHHRLPFRLVSDEKGQLRDRYGVPRSFLGLVAGRVTYVIDPKGVVRHVFNSQVQATRHVKEALEIISHMKS